MSTANTYSFSSVEDFSSYLLKSGRYMGNHKCIDIFSYHYFIA